jgi:hypothetical protein
MKDEEIGSAVAAPNVDGTGGETLTGGIACMKVCHSEWRLPIEQEADSVVWAVLDYENDCPLHAHDLCLGL